MFVFVNIIDNERRAFLNLYGTSFDSTCLSAGREE